MKLLVFADLHGNRNALKKIVAKSEKNKPDAIVCAGDLTIFESGIHSILFTLSMLKVPVMVVPGNHEGSATLKKACGHFSNIKFIHSDKFILGNSCFIGYGGGGFSVIDEGFERAAKKLEEFSSTHKSSNQHHKQGNKQDNKMCRKSDNNIIMAFHAPPHGTKLDWLHGQHCGNKSYRQFIEKVQPELVVCGHLHENRGKKDYIGRTLIINPGPEGEIIALR